jgi:DNA-binding CsgD family transcriptional regulator
MAHSSEPPVQSIDRLDRRMTAMFSPPAQGVPLREASPRMSGPVPVTANLDPGLVVTAASADFFRHLGRPSTEACGASIYDFFHPSAQTVLPKYFTLLTDQRRPHFVVRLLAVRPGGQGFSVEVGCVAVRGEGHELSGYVIQLRPDEALPGSEPVVVAPRPMLSVLDARILESMATGASTLQMAAKLYLSRQGVEYHVGLMLRQLKAPNRTALVSRAYSMGILSQGNWPPRVFSEFVK